jgi:S-adenosylmethionine decarboxylase
VDIFSCGDVVQPQEAIDHLTQVFGAKRISVVELQRGLLVENPILALQA